MRFGDGCRVVKHYARTGRYVEVIEHRDIGVDGTQYSWELPVPGWGGTITADEWAKVANEAHALLHENLGLQRSKKVKAKL